MQFTRTFTHFDGRDWAGLDSGQRTPMNQKILFMRQMWIWNVFLLDLFGWKITHIEVKMKSSTFVEQFGSIGDVNLAINIFDNQIFSTIGQLDCKHDNFRLSPFCWSCMKLFNRHWIYNFLKIINHLTINLLFFFWKFPKGRNFTWKTKKKPSKSIEVLRLKVKIANFLF